MMRWIVCLAAMLACSASFAADTTSFSFNGCTDAAGQAVATKADPALDWIAQARLDENGTAVIRYNPGVRPDLLPEARLFVFAHECARIALGQALSAQRSFEEIRAADCWALGTLERSKVIRNPATLEAVEMELATSSDVWQLIPQTTHELYLAACPRSAGSRGKLALPKEAGSHPDQWNACVQSCGAKLYSCGRAASCMSRYEACTAACGKK